MTGIKPRPGDHESKFNKVGAIPIKLYDFFQCYQTLFQSQAVAYCYLTNTSLVPF